MSLNRGRYFKSFLRKKDLFVELQYCNNMELVYSWSRLGCWPRRLCRGTPLEAVDSLVADREAPLGYPPNSAADPPTKKTCCCLDRPADLCGGNSWVKKSFDINRMLNVLVTIQSLKYNRLYGNLLVTIQRPLFI